MASEMSAEELSSLRDELMPQRDHGFSECFESGVGPCDACRVELALALERERLKSLVLAFATNKMHRPWLVELAALFEVTP